MGSRLAPLAFEFNGRDEFPCGGRECPQYPGRPTDRPHSRRLGGHSGLGIRMFDIPLELPAVAVGVAWHPRNDDDAAHTWLRGLLIESFARLPV
ncbi:Putative transcriptional regulator, LysR family [Mycobacteroides abscessus subsp. abscessus]|nr:Putative transcriptional regulator, LysR family [Mycobacteroides abscessus subsp. abscessus]SLD03183.1 Putative transcriptional regulator, LysR family [Mycobacteroides abscessus subsp. abscessus]SLE88773.1 Putative transcriptional regulator, LysR family [Mycobacteroides abscessus subsp. abscessus]